MLILARKLDESLIIGDGIEVKVVAVQGTGDQATVRLGVVAPQEVRIWRKEVYDAVVAENQQALLAGTHSGPDTPSSVRTRARIAKDTQRVTLSSLIVRPEAPPEKA